MINYNIQVSSIIYAYIFDDKLLRFKLNTRKISVSLFLV